MLCCRQEHNALIWGVDGEKGHFSGALRSRSALPILLGLLAASILINYVDRGNLAVAAPLLKDELHLSTTQIGILISAFFWTYTAVMAVSGWIVDR